jgi:hypothetical protein
MSEDVKPLSFRKLKYLYFFIPGCIISLFLYVGEHISSIKNVKEKKLTQKESKIFRKNSVKIFPLLYNRG